MIIIRVIDNKQYVDPSDTKHPKAICIPLRSTLNTIMIKTCYEVIVIIKRLILKITSPHQIIIKIMEKEILKASQE